MKRLKPQVDIRCRPETGNGDSLFWKLEYDSQ